MHRRPCAAVHRKRTDDGVCTHGTIADKCPKVSELEGALSSAWLSMLPGGRGIMLQSLQSTVEGVADVAVKGFKVGAAVGVYGHCVIL